jgi:PAS domain S-box-containing protein
VKNPESRSASTNPLEGQDALLLGAFSAMASGVLITDNEGQVLYANPRVPTLLGKSHSECVGTKIDYLIGSIEQLLAIEQRSRGTDNRSQIDLRASNGATMVFGFSLRHFDTKERRNLYVCVFQNISAHEELIRERGRLLSRAVVAELLPSILHELKNPLASITTAVELMLEEVTDDALRKDLKAVYKEARRMDLGMQGFAVAGRELRSSRRWGVADAIHHAVRILEPLAEEAKVDFRLEMDRIPELALNADVVRGIVFNLVRSSLVECRAGDRIDLSARLGGDDTFELRIVDTGSPPPSSIDSAPGSRIGRVGVALLLCKRACEGAGGSFNVKASEAGGTDVTVQIPQARGLAQR